MSSTLHKDKTRRQCLAVSLCFATTILMSLEALHPGSCAWMGLTADQSYTFNSAFAAVSAFLGAYILSQIAAAR